MKREEREREKKVRKREANEGATKRGDGRRKKMKNEQKSKKRIRSVDGCRWALVRKKKGKNIEEQQNKNDENEEKKERAKVRCLRRFSFLFFSFFFEGLCTGPTDVLLYIPL